MGTVLFLLEEGVLNPGILRGLGTKNISLVLERDVEIFFHAYTAICPEVVVVQWTPERQNLLPNIRCQSGRRAVYIIVLVGQLDAIQVSEICQLGADQLVSYGAGAEQLYLSILTGMAQVRRRC